jgi:hypothetical protein
MVSPAGSGVGGGSVRALKVLVVVMGVLIVLGTVALAWVIVQRVATPGGGGGGAPWTLVPDLPEGARVAGIAPVEGGALAVWITGDPQGDRLIVVDPRRGRVLGEIRVRP